MSRSLFATLLLLLCAVLDLAAQAQPVDLVPGRRIRVHRRAEATLVGELVSLGSDSLTMTTTAADTLAVAHAAITQLDLSMGTKSQAGKGAVRGLIFGGLGGVVLGLLTSAGQDPDEWFYVSPGAAAAGGAVMFGAIGAGLGAIIGSGNRTDKWEPTVWPVRVIAPGGQAVTGVALGVHLSF